MQNVLCICICFWACGHTYKYMRRKWGRKRFTIPTRIIKVFNFFSPLFPWQFSFLCFITWWLVFYNVFEYNSLYWWSSFVYYMSVIQLVQPIIMTFDFYNILYRLIFLLYYPHYMHFYIEHFLFNLPSDKITMLIYALKQSSLIL